MNLRQTNLNDELRYSRLPNLHRPLCVLSHKTQGSLLYPRPKYVKTEEIAERKGVIFLHLKDHAWVWVYVRLKRAQVRKARVPACVRSTWRENESERKRNQPLIRWSQLITFSSPDGRHSSNLQPQLWAPSVFTRQSPIWGKQAWVYAGHRNRWAADGVRHHNVRHQNVSHCQYF